MKRITHVHKLMEDSPKISLSLSVISLTSFWMLCESDARSATVSSTFVSSSAAAVVSVLLISVMSSTRELRFATKTSTNFSTLWRADVPYT